ncbi:hypothetical protein BP6252_08320 [Coleophoma cylindrospora]|uniref:Uncharacterized protein n=1 Tax=Coleophoma cylindrospora TaxID=1849047 RepID=A0A3D8R5S1_9HELO|nr:hypothetical protein BP6252_08320 [Coleophoma cylindrospora]
MSSLKRPHMSGTGASSDGRPPKAAKLSHEAEVQQLRAQIAILQRFIVEQGLQTSTWQGLLTKTPPEIRTQLENSPIAAETINKSIRAGIDKAYYALEAKIWELDLSITSDDMSRAMVEYIPQIQKLAEISGGLSLAYDALLYLGEHSYARVAGTSFGYGSRPSDRLADELLYSLAKRRKDSQPDYNPLPAVERLGKQISYLRERGIESFFLKSYNVLSAWVKGPEAADRTYNSLKAQITTAHQETLNEIDTPGSECYGSPSYVLASKMEQFIPDVRSLAYVAGGGLRLAFDLTIFLGLQYYGSLGSKSYHKGYGKQVRPFDNVVDELLVEIAMKIKDEEPGFAPVAEVEELEKRDRRLKKVGIKTCFPKSINLMWPWLPGAAAKFHEDIKKRIIKSYEKSEKQLHDPLSQHKRASSDWHSIRSEAFIPEIKRLNELPGGAILAFELLVLTAEHSYLRDVKLGPFYGWGDKAPEWWCPRNFDLVADDLLAGIAIKVKDQNPNFRPTNELVQLKNSHQYLAGYNIHTYFPKTIDVIESWPESDSVPRFEGSMTFPSAHTSATQLGQLNR